MAKITIQSGNKFTPTSTGVSPISQVGPVNRGRNQGVQGLIDLGINISEDVMNKRNRAIEVDYISDSTVKAQQDVARAREKALERDNPVGLADDIDREISKIHEKYLENAPSEGARNSLKSYFTSQRTGAFTASFNLENKLIADNALSKAAENINILANDIATNPSNLEQSLELLLPISESAAEVLDPAMHKKFIKEGNRTLTDSFIRGLISNSRLEEANKLLGDKRVTSQFEVDEIAAYKRAIDAQAKSNLDSYKAQRESEIAQINDDFLAKTVNRELTVKEVLESSLPAVGAKSKDFWLKRIESGQTGGEGNPIMYNRRYGDVDNMTEEEIFDLADPSKQSRPINTKQLESLLKAHRKEVDQTLKQYFSGIKSTLTESDPLTGIVDPDGDLLFMQLKFEAEEMAELAKEQGITVQQMFDPNSPRYNEFGGALLNKYKKTPREIMEANIARFKKDEDVKPKKSASERLNELLGK